MTDRKKALSINIFLLLITPCVTLLAIEITLRTFPKILGQDFANGVLNRYHLGVGGIYYSVKTCEGIEIRFMKPNFKAEMYYNGYEWQHETDYLGFRNPPRRNQADLLLLGDSYIYGHGANYDQTVAYFLEKLSKKTVYNLARQGDSAYQQYFLLSQYITKFKPQYVFYFFFQNDIQDFYLFNDASITYDRIEAYIQSPIELVESCDTGLTHPPVFDDYEKTFSQKLLQRPYILRIFDFLSDQRAIENRVQEVKDEINDESSLSWRFTKYLILKMNYLAKKNGAEFVIVPITPRLKKHHEILKNFANANNIAFIDTAKVIDFENNPSFFLPVDTHFSPEGAQRMAIIVSGFHKEKIVSCSLGFFLNSLAIS